MIALMTMMVIMMMMMTSSGSFILGLLPSRLVIAVIIVLCFLRAFVAALIGGLAIFSFYFYFYSNF